MFWLIAFAVVLVLGALAWWSSGRAKGKVPPGLGSQAETDRGWATMQAQVNRDGANGGGIG